MESTIMEPTITDVRQYWNSHLNCTQFLKTPDFSLGSDDFYEELENTVLRRYAYKFTLLEEFAKGCEGQTLLEVGCGLGIELGKLGKLGFDVTGIDLAPAAVDLAGRYLKRLHVKGRTRVQNAEQMDFPDESFDAVYSSGVIQHTPDIRKAIAEMFRVLRPGGKMMVILYHRRSWFYLLHKLTGVNIEFGDKDAPIINAYTRQELRSLFGNLRNVKIDCEHYYPLPTNRTGLLSVVYNYAFVPGIKIVPVGLIKHFGWHLVLTGVK